MVYVMLLDPPKIKYNISKSSYRSKGSFAWSAGFSDQYTQVPPTLQCR